MRTLRLTVAYDGTRLVGWQRQAAGESVQGLLEAALTRFEGGPVTVHGAGRTDAGVHALGQVASAVVSCSHDPAALLRGLNAQLPGDVRVLGVTDAPDSFHARFSARYKTYRYLVRTGPIVSPFERAYAWHVPGLPHLDRMQAAAALLLGRHDFSAFQSAGSHVSTTERTLTRSDVHVSAQPAVVDCGQDRFGPLVVYEVAGDGFLRHMVRAIVGTLVEVGAGRRQVDDVAALAAGAARAQAGPTAPPQGLYLVRVDYD